MSIPPALLYMKTHPHLKRQLITHLQKEKIRRLITRPIKRHKSPPKMAPPEVATQTTATPWLATRTEEKDIEDASKLVEWYQPALKALPASTLEVFTKYVGLKSEEEVKEHIYKLRDKAWNV